MRLALAQLNPIVGDLAGNTQRIVEAWEAAQQAGADLVVTPELALSGYPPKDLLLRAGFVDDCDQALEWLAKRCAVGPALLVGHPTRHPLRDGPMIAVVPRRDERVANAASLLEGGQIQAVRHKSLLPNYDVFDERRYFRPAARVRPIVWTPSAGSSAGRQFRLGVHLCEDAWWGEKQTFYDEDPCHLQDPVRQLAEQQVDLFINLSASPFEIDKLARRGAILQRHVAAHRRPFVFVNQVGGNDDLVFDGHSLAVAANGAVVHRSRGFETDLTFVDMSQLLAPHPLAVETTLSRESQILDALTLGLRDYLQKSGFTDCVLGLSGGIDSALAAAIAARAVGPQRVHGLLMPSRYSSDHSVEDARALAVALGIDWSLIPIDAVHRAYESTAIVGDDLRSQPLGLSDQNLQARIRGALVMIRSNRQGWLALATGNKSELAIGYCTLYGDMAGGFAVLCDLFKEDVYRVARWINATAARELIPQRTLEKAPSAELAPNQFDQDTLPPYPLLDAILYGLVECEQSVAELSQRYPAATVRWVAERLDRNEFKRRQLPPGIKLTARAFGSGRRMPMAARVTRIEPT